MSTLHPRAQQAAKSAFWLVVIAVSGVGFTVSSWRHRALQRSVHRQADLLITQVRQARLERLSNPFLEQDERAAQERERWTSILTNATVPASSSAKPRSTAVVTKNDVTSSDQHWAWRPLQTVSPPGVADHAWPRNAIDHFILAAMEEQGRRPAPPASNQVLARRLHFDLLGLPPDEAALKQWSTIESLQHYDQLVESLLQHSAFGERWAQIWLDVARYADSNGYEEDEIRPHAYPFRDFVIWAMNEDLPYDQFIRWQIAGDEIAPTNPLAVAATGFLTAGPYNTFLPQPSERRDELDDIVSTIGSSMLALTVGCARCHDHMYDPFPLEEYSRLVAIFADTQRTHRYLAADGGQDYLPIDDYLAEMRELQRARVMEEKIAQLEFSDAEKDLLRQPVDPQNAEQARLLAACNRCRLVMDHELSADIEPLPKDLPRFRWLQQAAQDLAAQLPPPPPKTLCISGSRTSRYPVLPGGQPTADPEFVGPGFPTALTQVPVDWSASAWLAWCPSNAAASPRTALAHWLTDVEQGSGALLARVIVNRLWQHHFGRGLVPTCNDFGSQGDTPTHPELLEWLASELVQHGWSLKHIHRLIVTSATYRQGPLAEQGPLGAWSESLFVGYVPQRMTAEMLRDALLAAAGNLNADQYGPAVFIPLPREAIYNKEDQQNLIWPAYVPERPAIWRRSIYVMNKRTNPVPLEQLFDGVDGSISCGQRTCTTVPTQALALMNSHFVRSQAERFAARLLGEPRMSGTASHTLVERAYVLALGRPVTAQELSLAQDFLSESLQHQSLESALADLCQVLFMSNEFLFID